MKTELVNDVTTVTGNKTKKPDIRKEAIKYSENEKIEGYRLAELISIIYEKELWKEWGFVSFEQYGEKELNRKYKTMRNYAVAGDTIRRTKVPLKEVAKVDKSTFNLISSLAEAENYTKEQILDVITEVENVSYEQAKEIIKSKRVKDEVVKRVVKFDLRFSEEQWGAIEPIIEEAKKIFNTDNVSLITEYVFSIWFASRNPDLEQKIVTFLKEKGLTEPIKNQKVKRKEPSHKGKNKNK